MKVFISYKRSAEPDKPFACELYEALRQHCDVLIGQTMPVSTAWAEAKPQEKG